MITTSRVGPSATRAHPARIRFLAARLVRRAALDGVRGLAALGVLVFHVWLYRDNRHHGARHALLDHLLFSANAGLIAFFVLSGFLLYRPYARGHGPRAGEYARRRIARIVP